MTRRELAGLAIAAAALGGADAAAAASAESPEQLLSSILELELLAVFAYQQVLASGALSMRGERLARQLLAHEHQHVIVISAALERLGQAPPDAPVSAAQARDELSAHGGSGSFAGLHTEEGCLRLLVSVQQAAIGACFDAMSKLEDPALLRTVAEMMGADAQHATVLADLLHHGDVKQSVPGAFVEGTH